MKKRYGWIFAVKGKLGVYSAGWGESGPGMSMGTIPVTSKLSRAIVIFTRQRARKVKAGGEKVFRVELTESGKPKKIIGRG